MSPIEPVPTTATWWPEEMPESETPRTTQARGSTMAACRKLTPSAMANMFLATMRAGMREYCA